MSDYIVATHESTEARDWLCGSCHAYGHAAVHARGVGQRDVGWFVGLLSGKSSEEAAHDDAAEDLDRDARRIHSLIKCPKCGRRAPGAIAATAWYGLFDVCTALASALGLALIGWAVLDSATIGILAGAVTFLVLMLFGNERRRWKAAAKAHVAIASRPSRPSRPSQPPRTSRPSQKIARTESSPTTPSVASPSSGSASQPIGAAPESTVPSITPPTSSSPVPIVPGDPTEQPKFLR
jgi:hypothetical protein